MQNGLFTANWATVGQALVTAVATAVLVGLYGVVTTTGFNVLNADWNTIGGQMLTLAAIAGVVSLAQDFVSTNNGSVLAVGPTN